LPRFPELEKSTLEQWRQHRVFETCLEQSQGKPIFRFDDGPPFGTGKPHYGHILAGTIKDAVTRFAHQTGHHVPRRFGWDCHGLPVEQIVDKKLGIASREQVEALGLDKYNAACRQTVLQCADDWRETVARMGRFVDFDGAYTTMSTSYMESVWWAFAQLHAKSLLYRGYKVMPYSVGCRTSISNMEAGLDFRDASDPTVIVAFELVDRGTFLLAWTTTAWTLPANMALGVHPEYEYAQVRDTATQRIYVLASSRLCELYKAGESGKYEVMATLRGSDLVGRSYLHPIHTDTRCPVIAAKFVSETTGTGIVHLAPGHGEEDYDACLTAQVIRRDQPVPCAVDESGLFIGEGGGGEFAGRPYKAAERDWIAHLKKRGIIVKQAQVVHRVAFCWRSGVPLIHRAQPSWFVRVEQLKERLLAHNADTRWQPDFVKTKRFHNWLTESRDWAVSRSRYWGTPLPVWSNVDGSEIAIIGSIAELRARATGAIDPDLGADLHLDKLRHVTLRSAHPGGSDLFLDGSTMDCWFESACAPFASQHYPFENRERFEARPVADFVAEGLDQTRGWFYTMLIMSTALFDRAPFRNVIVNGLVLAEDGEKMSKLKQNYPDPVALLDECGADALRAYLLSSPAVHADPLRFRKQGVLDVIKTLLLPWFHVLRYFIENAQRYERATGRLFLDSDATAAATTTTDMDRWLLAQANSLVGVVRREMAAYRLAPIVAHLVAFVEDMRTTYIALNRERLKGAAAHTPSSSTRQGLDTLRTALVHLAVTAAPFVPFFSEFVYQQLIPSASFSSVHYASMPVVDASLEQPQLQLSMQRMQIVLALGRAARDKRHLTMKMPVQEVVVVHNDAAVLADLEQNHSQSLINGLRCKQLRFSSQASQWMQFRAEPNRRTIGQQFGARSKSIVQAIAAWTQDDMKQLRETGLCNTLTREHVDVSVEFCGDTVRWQDAGDADFLVLVDATPSAELALEFYIREVARQAQQLRKIAKLTPTDKVRVYLVSDAAQQMPTDAEHQLLTPEAQALLKSLLGQEVEFCAAADLSPPARILISAPVVHTAHAWLVALVLAE
jgi:isoleucyl-tRNA synthetase